MNNTKQLIDTADPAKWDGRTLEASDLRERFEPLPGDSDYLHLADLRLALDSFKTDGPIRMLDYGCGGSPYRQLFPNAEYRRADYGDWQGLDYAINDDGSVAEVDCQFDMVLSTQVAEHAIRPEIYFRECYRLLKPGGRLICSTHGSYVDHAFPHDYQRWTAEGLRRDLASVGFDVTDMRKLTTGPRALMYFADRFNMWLLGSRSTLLGIGLWVFRTLARRYRSGLHSQCDRLFPANRVVSRDLEAFEHSLYVVLLAVAAKPRSESFNVLSA